MSLPPGDPHYERRTGGVEGMNRAMIPRGRRGYAPPTTGLRKTHPYRGATPADPADGARFFILSGKMANFTLSDFGPDLFATKNHLTKYLQIDS